MYDTKENSNEILKGKELLREVTHSVRNQSPEEPEGRVTPLRDTCNEIWKKSERIVNDWSYTPSAQRSWPHTISHVWCPWQSSLASGNLETTRDILCISTCKFSSFPFRPCQLAACRPLGTQHSCQVSCQAKLVYSRSRWQLSPRACCLCC